MSRKHDVLIVISLLFPVPQASINFESEFEAGASIIVEFLIVARQVVPGMTRGMFEDGNTRDVVPALVTSNILKLLDKRENQQVRAGKSRWQDERNKSETDA